MSTYVGNPYVNAVKFGETCKMATPSQVPKGKGVESRRPPPKSKDMVKAYSGPQTVRVAKAIVVKITRLFRVQVSVRPRNLQAILEVFLLIIMLTISVYFSIFRI